MTSTLDKTKPQSAGACSVQEQLCKQPGKFDFYQAVDLLQRQAPSESSHRQQAVRFQTPASTAFPASEIESIQAATGEDPARMVVSFMGVTGPSGVLPRHYTEQLVQLQRRVRGAAKHALHAWYDLFSNRFIGQLYRAWAGRRIDRGVVGGDADRIEPDRFTNALHSLAGVGAPSLRDRLQVRDKTEEWTLDRVVDQALARHAGVLARRQRPASQIEAVLTEYFQTPIKLLPFQGQWLSLDDTDRTRAGMRGQANRLGVDALLGGRVWDLQSRVRLQVGPLNQERFEQFLPETTAGPRRRRFQMLCQMTRFLLGPCTDFDVQLVLQQTSVPRLQSQATGSRRLGWDAWLTSEPLARDGNEPVFEPIETTTL
ncbi:type VI secretion system baseplate subunit TssG [Botrimarina mediterranea]|uniref:Type VI secretion protein, VC_A0111 family n=1 Tax=Botrimarina mediterranea TaxID=2528022 RepID=A0A518K881_9BACT|nr:type VI secretion system baseplate subunit TssG [Botrimarina mediterranea]QDV74006.1 hypothetical protein Spa11_22050 [Botrimarina mediterranea]QDV78636.1 hypothetical protein K2D_22430 [Planctomycetes bacterium K2D]